MGEKRHIGPDTLRYWLHEAPFPVGEARALSLLGVNRTTLGRWLAGTVKVPHSAALVLRTLAEGIPFEGGDHWQGFRFDGNEMVTPTGERVSARRLEKWGWLEGMRAGQIAALESQVADLQAQLASVGRLAGSANDAVMDAGRPATGSLSNRAPQEMPPPLPPPAVRRPPR